MIRLLLLVLPLVFQYWEDSETVSSLKAHVGEITLAQNEGRAPGSEGEKAVAAYLWKCLRDKGLDMLTTEDGDLFGVRSENGDTLVSRNVAGYIQGYDPVLRGHFIVVGARIDNLGEYTMTVDGAAVRRTYTGANGNASGVAALIELAGMAAKNSMMFRRSVIFIGFGSSTSSFAGAWHFLHHTFRKDADKIDAMVNLDMLGVDSDGMLAYPSGNEDLMILLNRMNQSPQPVKPEIAVREPYPSDHQIFYAEEIPSVMFTTGRYAEHNTPKDTPSILNYDFMEQELEYMYNFLVSLSACPEGTPSFRVIPQSGADRPDEVVVWSDCDVPPSFLGNRDPGFFLGKWVYPYLKYPQECITEGVQGRVLVEFVIGRDGRLTDARVLRSPDERLSAAALKVVEASPKWKPGLVHGKKVNSVITIPVEFRLKRKK